MSPGAADGRWVLQRIAAGYRRRRAAAAALLVIGVAAAGFGLARFLPPGALRIALAAGVVVVAGFAAARSVGRTPRAAEIARHLDRIDPALEESAELLLADEEGLGIAGRLERGRAGRAIATAPTALGGFPDATARRMAATGGAGLGIALASALFASLGKTGASDGPGGEAQRNSTGEPGVRAVSIEVSPPPYLGGARRRQADWELDVEEGARVTWTIELHRAVPQPRLVLSTGDTVPLAPDGRSAVSGSAVARASALYQLVHGEGESEYHRLLVRRDEPPAVTVLRPAPRTALAAGAGRRLPVETFVRDDHGVGGAALVATVTSGEGEGVRFREQRIPLGAGTRARGGTVYRRTLDLDSLGMIPGDELYFHALAHDNRAPRPNEGRSETVFISLADTATSTPAEFSGLAGSVLPEYFRSQRQIIIDTERLIADAPILPADIFRERANAIGMDQGLLRLRYGAFTGEEFESAVEPDRVHQHDSEESATLLAPATKATLKGAIAEMWEAELRLRTYRPADALPYERRALELLKSVQQASRAYVQRVGFAPPPLEPGRTRLSGKLDGIRTRAISDTVVPLPRQPAIVAALDRAEALAQGLPAHPSDPAALESAAAEIAQQRAEGPAETAAQLDAIRAVRALAATLRSATPCPGCPGAAVRALAARLDAAPRAPRLRSPATSLARRYLDLIDAP